MSVYKDYLDNAKMKVFFFLLTKFIGRFGLVADIQPPLCFKETYGRPVSIAHKDLNSHPYRNSNNESVKVGTEGQCERKQRPTMDGSRLA